MQHACASQQGGSSCDRGFVLIVVGCGSSGEASMLWKMGRNAGFLAMLRSFCWGGSLYMEVDDLYPTSPRKNTCEVIY